MASGACYFECSFYGFLAFYVGEVVGELFYGSAEFGSCVDLCGGDWYSGVDVVDGFAEGVCAVDFEVVYYGCFGGVFGWEDESFEGEFSGEDCHWQYAFYGEECAVE